MLMVVPALLKLADAHFAGRTVAVGCTRRGLNSYQRDWSSAVGRLVVDFGRSAVEPVRTVVDSGSFAVAPVPAPGSETETDSGSFVVDLDSFVGFGNFAADLGFGSSAADLAMDSMLEDWKIGIAAAVASTKGLASAAVVWSVAAAAVAAWFVQMDSNFDA